LVLIPTQDYTIEKAIRQAAQQFEHHALCYGHGTDTATDEASWLILHAIGHSPAVAPDYATRLSSAQVEACNLLISRRIHERIPAAYLTGMAWFAGHEFLADSRALVPRSPLAEFINSDFYGLLAEHDAPAILDLCTGGGCIAIACAYASLQSTVHASDLSPQALALAADNIDRHHMQTRIELFQGSLFEPISGQYDLIISNPPYVDQRDIDAMPAEFAHEPMLGLAAGTDGLDLVRIMLRDAVNHLAPSGYLVVEVGNSWEALEAVYPALEFNWLEFTSGGDGVFMLDYDQLIHAQDMFSVV